MGVLLPGASTFAYSLPQAQPPKSDARKLPGWEEPGSLGAFSDAACLPGKASV